MPSLGVRSPWIIWSTDVIIKIPIFGANVPFGQAKQQIEILLSTYPTFESVFSELSATYFEKQLDYV